jgi:hypothetical protein
MAPRSKQIPLVPILVQLALAVLGFWTLWGFPYNNHLLKYLKAQTEPGATVPGVAGVAMKQSYTGIGPVDNQLTILVSFFYTAIDGQRGDISLSFLCLGSHVIASWVLIALEGQRTGNQGKAIITSTTLLGLAVAIVGFAVIAPLLFAYQLYASPTVMTPAAYPTLPKSPLSVALIPIGILIGFGFPSLVMTFPAPSVLSFETKQLWTGIQQGWTFWIYLATLALTIVISAARPSSYAASTEETTLKVKKNMRRIYLFAIASGAAAHLVPLLLCSLATLFPLLFAEPYASQLELGNVFSLANPFGNLKAGSLADGALWFLQWDTFVGAASVLLWALTLRSTSRIQELTPSQWVMEGSKILALSLIAGPTVTAVIAIWARDELAWKQSGDQALQTRSKDQ